MSRGYILGLIFILEITPTKRICWTQNVNGELWRDIWRKISTYYFNYWLLYISENTVLSEKTFVMCGAVECETSHLWAAGTPRPAVFPVLGCRPDASSTAVRWSHWTNPATLWGRPRKTWLDCTLPSSSRKQGNLVELAQSRCEGWADVSQILQQQGQEELMATHGTKGETESFPAPLWTQHRWASWNKAHYTQNKPSLLLAEYEASHPRSK